MTNKLPKEIHELQDSIENLQDEMNTIKTTLFNPVRRTNWGIASSKFNELVLETPIDVNYDSLGSKGRGIVETKQLEQVSETEQLEQYLDSIFTQLQESDDRINADIVETSVLGRETRELLAELEKKVS